MSPCGEKARIARLMPILPYSILWLILLLAAVLSLVLSSRPRVGAVIAAVALVLAGGLWFWGRPPEPGATATATWLGYSWRITSDIWHLTGLALVVLLVGVAAYLGEVLQEAPAEVGSRQLPLLLMVGVGVLPFVWSGDPLTAATMLASFAAAWAFAYWLCGPRLREGRFDWRLVAWLVAPLLLVWLADAIALSGTTNQLSLELARAAVLLAGAILLGVWPFGFWRGSAAARVPALALTLMSLPVIAGVAVLLPVAQEPAHSGTQLALAVVLGLMSPLMALRAAGRLLALHPGGAASVAGALAGLVLLAAVFASEETLLAATRVAVAVPLLLGLVTYQRASAVATSTGEMGRLAGASHVIALIFAWLAVLGLPLTAGFTSLVGLYSAWQTGSTYVLLGTLALLLALWSVVLAMLWLRLGRQVRYAGTSTAARPAIAGVAPFIIALIPLAQMNLGAFSSATVITWLAILIPLLVGPIAAWFLVPRLDAWEVDFNALIPAQRIAPLGSAAKQGWALAGDAVAEALAVLEGPSGMLWILIVVVLLLLIS